MSRDGWRKKASEGDGWGVMGGYMAAKVSKLEEQFMRDAPREKEKQGTSSTIFSGVAIHVNGYTEPSADELRRLMMLHGGQFHVYYSHTRTTHIIATNLPNFKIKELRGEKVVRPEWITDSIKAGQQLSYLQYQLYAKQKGLNFASVRPRQVQEQTEVGQGPSQFNLNLPQPGNLHNSTIPQSVPSKPTEKTNHQMISRLNGSCIGVSKEEGPKHNGIHDGYTCKLSKGHFQKNGYVPPLNGALKQRDNVSYLKSTQRKFRCPQPKPEETSVLASDSAASTVSTSLQASPSGASRYKSISDSTVLSEPTSTRIAAFQEKPADSERFLGQKQSSPVRLNGSHHNTSDLSLPANQSAQGPETGIISEFFSHSRLHHISTWRSEFSEYVNTLQSKRRSAGGTVFAGKEKLKKLKTDHFAGTSFMPAPQVYQSCILHVDMDCFFASVGIRHRPELRGKPVAVTSNRGRGLVPQRPGANPQLEFQYYQRKQNQHRAGRTGDCIELTPSQETEEMGSNRVEHDHVALSMAEIASCSYEARQVGVRNGMFFGQAKQLCPDLQSVPYDFHAYKEVALAMYETLASYTYNIEALSCDEALVDATSLLTELGITPDELAAAIRADIREKTGCCASIGMSSNILLARMATRKAKPNGQYFLRPEEVDDFIRDQPVSSLPGVGRSMSSKLASLGVTSCGDLQQLSIVRLQKEFGPRTGKTLFRFCRGLDDRPVRSKKERKTVSAEMNYNIRFTNVEEAERFLTNLSLEVQKRLQGAGLRGRRVTLKVMMRKAGAPLEPAKYGGHGICDNLARSVLLPHPTDCGQLIAAEVIKLFHAMKLAVVDMRGVGLQVHLLESSHADAGPSRSRNIKEMLTIDLSQMSSIQKEMSSPSTTSCSFADSIPGTSKGETSATLSFIHSRADLNLSIEVPPPSQVDHSVLDALPSELREQVEQAWKHKQVADASFRSATFQQFSKPSVLLHLADQHGQTSSTGIILELPDFSQVDPDVFAALPRELQEELRSAYRRREIAQAQVEQRKPLLHLKQPAIGKTKRCYKRKNASPAKKGASPLKSLIPGNSAAKSSPSKTIPLLLKGKETLSGFKMENGPHSSSVSLKGSEVLHSCTPQPFPTLAGAFELNDVRALLREWVTTISEPMEEDILQVVKYCTELVEDKDLEKLDLVIKYMKRLMQQSVESVWSMAFDFILDNVQVVVQQTYGSTLKIP